MTRPESDPNDAQLLERYRKASDADPVAPTDAVRAAILAEARRVAEQAASSPRPVFDTSQPAANQSRWKMAAFGTLGAALLAALIVAPRLWKSPPPPLTATNQPAPAANAPAANAPAANAPAANAPAPNVAVPVSPPPAAGLQAQTESRLAEVDSESFAKRAATAAARADRLTASLERRKAAEDSLSPNDYTPDTRIAAEHPGRISSFAARSAAPASTAGARSKESAPAVSLGAAAASGDSSAVERLLDQGATLDARDDLGRTPLMLATLNGQIETVRLLLSRGANPNIADNEGRTALQQAQTAHLDEISRLLRGAGAQ
jgi:Ankyrin repeats (3 copies)